MAKKAAGCPVVHGATTTPKREAFALAVASGKTQADAYRAAFSAEKMKPSTIWSRASVLMADNEVKARVAELRKPVAERAQLTLQSHLNNLEALRDEAIKTSQLGAAIAAEVARGKAAGLYVIKTEISANLAIREMSDAELDTRLAHLLQTLKGGTQYVTLTHVIENDEELLC